MPLFRRFSVSASRERMEISSHLEKKTFAGNFSVSNLPPSSKTFRSPSSPDFDLFMDCEAPCRTLFARLKLLVFCLSRVFRSVASPFPSNSQKFRLIWRVKSLSSAQWGGLKPNRFGTFPTFLNHLRCTRPLTSLQIALNLSNTTICPVSQR